jgi:tRNA(Arg) A34 adenosine deaminase TadA
MAVLSKMRLQGDTEDLIARIRQHVEPVAERLAPKHGGLVHVIVRTDDGVMMVNVWETDEGRHAMAEEPEIQAALRAAGLPEPNFKAFEVLELQVSERAPALTTA